MGNASQSPCCHCGTADAGKDAGQVAYRASRDIGSEVVSEVVQQGYEGQYKDSQRHGHGILKTEDGCVYEGQFAKNVLDGEGKCVFANGMIYEAFGQPEFKMDLAARRDLMVQSIRASTSKGSNMEKVFLGGLLEAPTQAISALT